MLRPLTLGLAIGFVSVFSFSVPASAQEAALPVAKVDHLWPSLDPSQRSMVDLLAADFFQNELSAAQRDRIFAARADDYRAAGDRDGLRLKARQEWQERQHDRQGTIPTGTSYDMLSDRQKAPFRRYAIDQLDLKPRAVAPGAAGRNDV